MSAVAVAVAAAVMGDSLSIPVSYHIPRMFIRNDDVCAASFIPVSYGHLSSEWMLVMKLSLV